MNSFYFKPSLLSLALAGMSVIYLPAGHAATSVDLTKNMTSTKSMSVNAKSGMSLHEYKRMVSANGTVHVRVQQTFQGYPVIGADSILHVPHGNKGAQLNTLLRNHNASMDGVMYLSLQQDLANTSTHLFTKAQADKAMQHALDLYQQKIGVQPITSMPTNELMIYVDEANKAHYVYRAGFYAEPTQDGLAPEVPTYIMDAVTMQVYLHWNDARGSNSAMTAESLVDGGGVGGTLKTGRLSYDGLAGHLASFKVTRDSGTATCTMVNDDSKLRRQRQNNPTNAILAFPCAAPDATHNNVYWSGELIGVNGGYSTANDAFANAQLVKRFFATNYGIPVVTKDGQPAQLAIYINYNTFSAVYAPGGVLSTGDGAAGSAGYFPFTTRDVISHELSHAVTQQYAKFNFSGQPGGINESFGDITAKAIERSITGSNIWIFAEDVFKLPNQGIRYLNQPSKDCDGRQPGDNCSIDHASQFKVGMTAQHVAGVYNRAMYQLSTTAGWNVTKTFNVMLAANMHYWTSTTNWDQGACGMKRAATDLGYDANAVVAAFNIVGVNPTC